MKKYTVTFQVSTPLEYQWNKITAEIALEDLIKTAVLPALELDLVPLTFTVKNSRN